MEEEISSSNDEIEKILEKEKNNIEINLIKEELSEFEYELPSFEGLAEDFDIERALDKESSFLLREIRKLIAEKLSAYLQLFETFMNPTSPPMFIFSALRNLDEKDREKIKKLYKNFSKYQLLSVKLDTIYNEENEAKFINQAYNEWQKCKTEIHQIIEKLEVCTTEKSDNNQIGYFN